MRSLLGLLVLPTFAFAQPTAEQLTKLNVTVAEPKALANMIAEHLRTRQREVNDRSTAAWKALANRVQWDAFAKPKLQALRDSLGTFPPPRVPTIRITATHSSDGFHIDNVLYESRPGVWVTGNLYRPAKPPTAMPGIVIVHAHHTPKEHGELQDMGMMWARAGYQVLVMDQLGHGERRQHPFVDASSFGKPYRVSRQDYFFRYDSAIQLHLVGESLIGWMAWDISRGVDVLLKNGCDPKRVILLGSVAGGGDPCAVAAALDDRITAAVPFNFGGPQPEARYPLPDDADASFNYMGGGSWESTRNLRNSARDGFLPWVIVGSLASRKLVYAHEFNWDRERDPVWKRFQTIAKWHDNADGLAFSYGRGSVRGSTADDTHCTHIGPVQRKAIHEAFRKWFAIDATEYRERLPAEKLKCWTPEVFKELKPKPLTELLGQLADERLTAARQRRERMSAEEQAQLLRADFKRLLGSVEPSAATVRLLPAEVKNGVRVERVLLTHENAIFVPVVLLVPVAAKNPPVVVVVSQAGKERLLKFRSNEFAELLAKGVAICLPDVRATGESSVGSGRGRTSAATSYSSSLLMHGDPLVAGQLRDLRTVLAWLRTHESLDGKRPLIWGDSLAKTNALGTNFKVPRDDDDALPAVHEPLGGMLALLAALYEKDVRAVFARGVPPFRDVLKDHLVLIPHDAVVPGLLTVGDVADWKPTQPVALDPTAPVAWLLKHAAK